MLAAQAPEEIERVQESVSDLWATLIEALPRVGVALGVLVVLVIVGRALRPLVRRRLCSSRTESFARVFAKLTSTIFTIAGVLLAMTIVFPSVKPVDVLTGAGILTVAVGFAFQDILSNLLAGILLLFRQPFTAGDQVEVDGFKGTVEEINIRETVIKTFDGRRVLVPNATVYTNSIEVQTGFGLLRTMFVVGVAYDADLDHARKVALEALAGVDGVAADPPPEALYMELAASTVNLEVRFWSNPHQLEVRRTLDRAIEEVKMAMDRAGIEIPVETVALQATPSLEAALAGTNKRSRRSD